MRATEFIIEGYPDAKKEFSRVADPALVVSTINQFKELLKKNQFKNEADRNIDNWRARGWEEFSRVVKLKTSIGTDTQSKRGKLVGDAIMLRDDAEWKVLIPLDKEASVHYGRGTKWCTTRPYDSYYESYVYDDKGILIYAIDQVGSGKRSVAILIKEKGEINLFNKQDKPIDATQYTAISGLDSNKYIEMAKLPENKTQIEESREIYNVARKETTNLLAATPLDADAVEVALKITKNHRDCYNFIKKYGTEQNKPVNVHPIILAAAAAHVNEQGVYESKRWAVELGKHIDFSKIPNATIKTALRLTPELFIYNHELLSKEQQSWLTSSPKSAYLYVMEIRKGERFPEVEHIIAQDAKSASDYATKVLRRSGSSSGEFPEGEAAIATDAEASYEYAYYVLKKRFPAGESAIAGDPTIAVRYVEDILHKPIPEAESEILETEHLAVRYGQALMGNTSPSWERLIKDNPYLIIPYVRGVKKRVPALEPKLAEDAHYALEYAKLLNTRFPAGEPVIARSSDYAYLYATEILKRPFPAGEEAMKLNPRVWKEYQDFLSTVAPVVNKDKRNQPVASSDAFSILSPNVVKTTEYFMANHNDAPEGPHSSANILRLMKMHHMQPDQKLIWRKGLNKWVTLANILPELDPTNYKSKNQPPPLPPENNAKSLPAYQYFFAYNGTQSNRSFPSKDILTFLKTDAIPKDAYLWRDGLTDWTPVSELMGELSSIQTEGRRNQRRNINSYNRRR